MKFKNYILIFSILYFFSCKKENLCDCVKTTGKQTLSNRNIANFNCIVANDKMDVYLTQGTEFEVNVDAGANIQKLIKTELDGETLKVFNTNRCNWVRGYKHKIKIYITAPYFKHIKNIGLGTIHSVGTITQNQINLRVENSGDIKLTVNVQKIEGSAHGNGDTYVSGIANELAWDFTGTNYLYTQNLNVTNYLYLHSVSIGKAYVSAPQNGLMDVILDKAGDVHYTGTPNTINLTQNNKGQLIKD